MNTQSGQEIPNVRSGRCMCGIVKFQAEVTGGFSRCHCKMCQRWASGVFMGVATANFEITDGAEALTVFKSSEWAQRAFCNRCGSNIYYDADDQASPNIAIGTLDDPSGLEMKNKWFVDLKPMAHDADAHAKTFTQAEVEALFGGQEE